MYKVIRMFIDKDSRDKYVVGDEYKTSSKTRAKELINLGRLREVEEVEEVKEVKKTKPKKSDAE